MLRLALHWQILIGMVAGSLIGLGLNLTVSTRSVSVSQGLPSGITQATISDSSERTEISYIDESENRIIRVIDPIGQDADVYRTLDELRNTDPVAAIIYLEHGQSTAKRWGGWFKKIGGLFLRMLQMVAVPLIVTSLLSGILGLSGGDDVGRMFRRTFFYYLSTSFLAIVTGLLVVNVIRPGLVNPPNVAGMNTTVAGATSLGDTMFNQIQALIPSNPLGALTAPNFLSIIAFTILFGLFAIRVGGKTLESIRSAAAAGFEVMMAMTTAIIRLAPIGVLFLMAYVTATQGAGVFRSLGWYVLAVALALLIHATITLPLILRYVAKRSPSEFARAMSPALLTAFSSASSNGTLPLTMSSVEQRAGISNKTGSFVLPLGATVNMDGTALYEVIAVLFIAQLHFGQNLPLSQQIVVAVTALLASIGAAGIPHAGLVMMVIVLQAVGLPLEMQGVILAVDRVLDMARTSVNVWSDSCGCAVVERLEQDTT
jgi:proton glutamate symport protein